MSQIQQNEKQIIIKGNSIFIPLCIGAAFMAVTGFSFLFEIIPFEEDYGIGDIFGLIFMLIWISVVLWMGFYSFFNFSKKIFIDQTGVTCSTILKKERYEWSEIEDYGLSYSGQVRGGGNTYDFYFAKTTQKQRNDCKKKLKGNLIKTFIFGDDYPLIVETIIPFCEKFSVVKPFVGVDKYHII